MVNLQIVQPLLLVALAAIAIYVQVRSSTLSLPLSTGTTVLTIILPFLAAANVFYTPRLNSILRQRIISSPALQLLPIALQLIQGVLTVVLATLAAEGFAPGQTLECGLEGNWQHLWTAHDGHAIERIQDALNCCGLHSIKDRDWPRDQCQKLYSGRHVACIDPWRANMQRTAGLEFTVAVAVGILQLIHLALFRLRSSGAGNAREGYRQITQRISANPREGLLEDGVADDGDNGNGAEGSGETSNGHSGYGALDDGPRIAPSNLGDEHNNWRSS
ncbi:hypothetical protein F4677DRAFT_402223 [Hypoxylon crocopeplum]|nr:hypothetical protein F4677DRAFT_402223 [Hypoxylon crocopeplum]